MFNFLKNKSTSFLGIDIGTKSIKLVELESVSGRPRLITYGMVEVDSDVGRDNDTVANKKDQEKIASALKSLIIKSGAKSRNAVAALPNFSVFSSVISLPKLGEKELAEAIQWEAKKFVPMPIENVVLDWKILDEADEKDVKKIIEQSSNATHISQKNLSKPNAQVKEKEKNPVIESKNLAKCKTVVNILLTAAPRHLVERYISIFKLSGLNLLSLETESFALARSLVGNEENVILVADVGSLTTDITVVKKGVPIFSRSINVGGKTVTQAIADSMGIDVERAEQFKRDVGISTTGNTGAGIGTGVSKIIQQSFSSVINEMKYTLETQERNNQIVEKILLTGGSAFLPSLDTYISKALETKVFIGNPWARVSHPKDLSGVLETVAPTMGVAIGLAMREIE